MSSLVLDIRGLHVDFHTDAGCVEAVRGVDFQLAAGRTLGLVGESGSGKSVTALALLQLLPRWGTQLRAEKLEVVGESVRSASPAALRALRGRKVGVVFQDPMGALNPVMRVGEQVAEAVRAHQSVSAAEAWARAVALFGEVGLPDPAPRARMYPHQLSGGQKQRVMIAAALANNPALLIADEPTTALDVSVQAQLLELLRRLQEQRQMAMLFISHDLGVIAEVAHEVAVMREGRIVERGGVETVLGNPTHPYTRGLLACRPRLDRSVARLPSLSTFLDAPPDGETPAASLRAAPSAPPARPAEPGAPLLSVEGLHVRFRTAGLGWFSRASEVHAVRGVSFSIARGESVGLVGESGSGKTTIGRAVLRLVSAEGRVAFDGQDVLAATGEPLRALRRRMQIVFQDPMGAMNPRQTVLAALTEPMEVHALGETAPQRRAAAEALLAEVGLSAALLGRYPHELSGGQRQRVVLARALSVNPELLVCDEAVSALDKSAQAQVLNLLKDLQESRGLAYLFISHDLSVVKFMSQRILVLNAGEVVEAATAEDLYARPAHPYTRALLHAIPERRLAALERAPG